METIEEDAYSSRQWVDFSCFSETSRMLIEDIAESIDKELGEKLYLSRTPVNVTRFFSPKGNAEGSVVLRAGKSRSKVGDIITLRQSDDESKRDLIFCFNVVYNLH
jgi:hypothetical protein